MLFFMCLLEQPFDSFVFVSRSPPNNWHTLFPQASSILRFLFKKKVRPSAESGETIIIQSAHVPQSKIG